MADTANRVEAKTPSQILKEARAKIDTKGYGDDCPCLGCVLATVEPLNKGEPTPARDLCKRTARGENIFNIEGSDAIKVIDKAIELAEQEEKGAGTNG